MDRHLHRHHRINVPGGPGIEDSVSILVFLLNLPFVILIDSSNILLILVTLSLEVGGLLTQIQLQTLMWKFFIWEFNKITFWVE